MILQKLISKLIQIEPGATYAEFNEKTDNIAEWTLGGLVAGKVLMKSGILVFLLKKIKLVIIGLIALGGYLCKYFKKRREEREFAEKVEYSEQNKQQ